MKILVATEKPFAPVAMKQIRDLIADEDHELLLLESYKNKQDLINAVSDVDALIVRSDLVTDEIVGSAGKLKIVVRAGAGYDNIDLEACSARDIVVMNTPGQNSNAVAELVFEMLLYHVRKGFSGKTGTELRGKTLGLHAFGNVGKYVAAISRGFGMHTFAYDPFIGENLILTAGAKISRNPAELYSTCQFVSIHLPANEKTSRVINYHLISRLPLGAILINTARKEIINEDDLLRMFEDRPDFSYLADVAPDCKAIIEERFPGRYLFTTKKMGAQTEEANINAGVAAARQIIDYFKTGNQEFKVNN